MGITKSVLLGSCSYDTIEPAEEVRMETTAVTTEQPQSEAPHTLSTAGEEPSRPTASALEGSPVDHIPLVDLSSSDPSTKEQGHSVGEGLENGSEDVADGFVSDERKGETVGKKSVHRSEVDDLPTKDGSHIDALSSLAKQIESFDPESLLKKDEKVACESSEFSRDINDEELIDDLVKGENSAEQTDTNVDKAGEVTPDVTDAELVGEVTVTDNVDNIKDNVDLSPTVQEVENGIESPNGSMSASTESEGFVENPVGQMTQEAPKELETTPSVTEKTEPQKVQESTAKKSETTEPQKQENTSPSKTGKSKKKEDKSIEHILRALSSLQTTEEKLAALCKKYADLHEDHRILQASFKQSQRKLTVVTREKDQLQTEHTKAVMAKSKLESLCRELQKQNQIIRQESLQRAKEEDEKRKEISQKFQTTIGEIQQQMQDNHDRSKTLREENFELASKLKKFVEQYEAREKQVQKVMQHRELEQKLADAKLEQASAILMEEKGRSQKEKEVLILQSTEYMKKMQLKDAETEKALQMYKERYEEFQSTISKSEEMFQKFKQEMDKMTKRIKKLEKEGAQWRGKWENANRALIEMAEEKAKYDKEKPVLLNKISKLESLCRAMQAERQARRVLESEGMDVSKLDGLLDTAKPPTTPAEPQLSTSSPATKGAEPTTGGSPQEVKEEGALTEDAESVAGTDDSGNSAATTVIPSDAPPIVDNQSSPEDSVINTDETSTSSEDIDRSADKQPEKS